ncbi:MAG: hypothetical protein M1829_002009 [Trizodia sp. TS-e1964]|nr:MAG: hypothetical protein M1829_002009 [Trizodia sp. TS-e1964]
MTLFRLFTSIQTQAYFQANGLVRMLIWVNDSEKEGVLPRAITKRKRSALHAETSCDIIHEVAGADKAEVRLVRMRERSLEIESAMRVEALMKQNGIETPETRKSRLQKELADGISDIYPDLTESIEDRHPGYQRKWYAELKLLERQLDDEKFPSFVEDGSTDGPEDGLPKRTPQFERIFMLRGKKNFENKIWAKSDELAREDKELEKLALDPSEESQLSYKSKLREHNKKYDACNPRVKGSATMMMDERKALHMEPPLLLWDRRTYEPLIAKPAEFSPKQQICLLDIHPSTNILAPIQTSKALDPAEFIPHFLFAHAQFSIIESLNRIAPGAADALIPQAPSMHDPTKGGRKDLKSLRIRMLTPQMVGELVHAWEAWPGRPSDAELWAKMGKFNESFTYEK